MDRAILATGDQYRLPTAEECSEPDVRSLAEARLRDSSYPLLRNIACEYLDGELTLRGRLPSYYMKQIALSLVRSISGVGAIADLIEITPPGRQHP